MKIKLISPRMTLRPMDSEYKRVLSPSISLLVIAALTPPEHEVTIADENVEKLRLKENRIFDFDYSHYNTSHVVFKPKNMTPEELYKGYIDIYHRFYSVNNILARLPDNFKNRMSFLLFNFGYRKFGKITSKVASVGLMNSLGKLARRLSYGIA